MSPSTGDLRAWERWCLAAGGLGFVPVAPGTFGSLGPALVLALVGPKAPGLALTLAGLFFVLGSAVTLAFSARAVRPDGRGDPGWVVSDEVAGQALASLPPLLMPLGVLPGPTEGAALLAWHGAAFGLFRLFDITKPGVVGHLERRPRAVGVLADDLGAGALAAALLALTALLLP